MCYQIGGTHYVHELLVNHPSARLLESLRLHQDGICESEALGAEEAYPQKKPSHRMFPQEPTGRRLLQKFVVLHVFFVSGLQIYELSSNPPNKFQA